MNRGSNGVKATDTNQYTKIIAHSQNMRSTPSASADIVPFPVQGAVGMNTGNTDLVFGTFIVDCRRHQHVFRPIRYFAGG